MSPREFRRPGLITTLVALILGATKGALGDKDIHVHPGGINDNDGSSTAPFASLHQAQEAVRDALSSGEEDVTVHLGGGIYFLDEALNLTAEDSGSEGHPVIWKANADTNEEVVLSGGLKIDNWTDTGSKGIYSADVPKGTQSRNLYVNGWAANYARRMIERSDFDATDTSMKWNSSDYDWIMEVGDLDGAEIRAVQAFTDRVAPIERVLDSREILMTRPSWDNNIIGYDTFSDPDGFYDIEFLTWIQGALSLLDDGGQFYLDSDAGRVYYKPLDGEDMNDLEAWLGVSEALVTFGGSYDEPAHDISFEGVHFAHTTWLKPGEGYGYVDQQTGGHIGENTTYPEFEATRPHWNQMPSAIQISAARNIAFTGGRYTQLGAGAFGIGNDANAYLSEVGLGVSNISVTNGYFTQVMGNSITAGGIRADAHHPSDPRMINSHITISENVFRNTSSLISSAVPIMLSYVQHSSVSRNDIAHVPYSGITHGYGWGANDEGGSAEYVRRGLYEYQPLYDTPTIMHDNLIEANIISDYGTGHADLGAVYTLSKSPSTYIVDNFAFDAEWFGKYTDEGANSYIITGNVLLSTGNWYAPNEGCSDCGVNTANNTLIDNFGRVGDDQVYLPDGTGVFNNTFLRNYNVTSRSQISAAGDRVAYRAGIPPAHRGAWNEDIELSNPSDVANGRVALDFSSGPSEGRLYVNLTNFDDDEFTDVSFDVSISAGFEIEAEEEPTVVPADNMVRAAYLISGSSGDGTLPAISVEVSYTNARTGKTVALSEIGTLPGISLLGSSNSSSLTSSATWVGLPATFGQTQFGSKNGSSQEATTFGIRTGGRGLSAPYDDWAALWSPEAVSQGNETNITVQLVSLDASDEVPAKAGLFIRANAEGGNATFSAPYAALLFDAEAQEITFSYASSGNGRLDTVLGSEASIELPACLRIHVNGNAEVSASFSGNTADCDGDLEVLGGNMDLGSSFDSLDAGILVGSGGGFREATGIFNGFEVS